MIPAADIVFVPRGLARFLQLAEPKITCLAFLIPSFPIQRPDERHARRKRASAKFALVLYGLAQPGRPKAEIRERLAPATFSTCSYRRIPPAALGLKKSFPAKFGRGIPDSAHEMGLLHKCFSSCRLQKNYPHFPPLQASRAARRLG